MRDEIKRLSYAVGSAVRVSQYLPQALIGGWFLGNRPSAEVRKTLPSAAVVLADLKELFVRDYQNIEAGLYKRPREIFASPLSYSQQTVKIFKDLVKVWDRKRRRSVQEFSRELDKTLPKYFQQNFHHQTDGYLSEDSADVYEHQVEVIFAGGAAVMRRQALVPLYHYLKSRPDEAAPVQLLDVACGTGSFLQELKENYPDLRATGLDLSPFYLKRARENLKAFTHMDFVEAKAEEMPFKDASFDVITNIYLFHELPSRVRQEVVQEMYRVLKPGGMLIFVDSIQMGDKPVFDESLKLFPQNYHEPYYLSFVKENLDELFLTAGFKKAQVDLAYFSKILIFRKD